MSNYTQDGLVYHEQETKAAELTPYMWMHMDAGPSESYFKRFRNLDGPASLQDMALRAVLRNRDALGRESLEGVEWEPLGRNVWEILKARKAINLSLWRAFATMYWDVGEARREIEYHDVKYHLPASLFVEAMPLLKSTQFLVSVQLHVDSMSLSDWMDLSKLENLQELAVKAENPGKINFSARVARAWGEHALQSNAFEHLKAMILWCNKTSLDSEIFEHLRSLKALRFLQFVGFDARRKLLKVDPNGWQRVLYGRTQPPWQVFGDPVFFNIPHEIDRLEQELRGPGSSASQETGTSLPCVTVRVSMEKTVRTQFQRGARETLGLTFLRKENDLGRKRAVSDVPAVSSQQQTARQPKIRKVQDIANMLSGFMK